MSLLVGGVLLIILAVVLVCVYWARTEAEIQRLEEEIRTYDFKEDTEADYT